MPFSRNVAGSLCQAGQYGQLARCPAVIGHPVTCGPEIQVME